MGHGSRAFWLGSLGNVEGKGGNIDLDARLNVDVVEFHDKFLSAAGAFASACHDRGVYMLPSGASGMRAVVHRDVGPAELDEALGVLGEVAGAITRTETA